jgi:RimJ/RimL family protein N-acetyltransferase
MRVFLETKRLILRQFSEADVENLVVLDSDPEVMRYLNGGIATPREVVERSILPRFLSYNQRSDGLGVWAAMEKVTGAFIGWFSLRPMTKTAATRWSLATGCGAQPGDRATRRRARGR